MDKKNNLDILIKKEFDELYSKLDKDNKKYLNPKTIKNIIFHLIENPEINPKKNKKLQELGEIRMKKKLLDYFKAFRNTVIDEHSAADLYKRYLSKIVSFMSEYYGFSGNGGKLIILTILILLTLGVFLDTICYMFNLIPVFTILFLLLFTIRMIIKFKHKKVYGFFY
tara:strand:- start:337 stop:840 length:504 start_codon:yes stop_codon:yes gene_type:complete